MRIWGSAEDASALMRRFCHLVMVKFWLHYAVSFVSANATADFLCNASCD